MRGALALAIVLATTVTALADTSPVIAVPGRAGVPVMINGRDASWAVVEGDWGLARDIHVQPTVLGGWDVYQGKSVGRYFPSSGRIPGYGRLEIEPPANRALPQPAESYYRSWSAESAAPTELQDIPQNPPPIIVAPEINMPRRPRR
jgi:hypothetical protein